MSDAKDLADALKEALGLPEGTEVTVVGGGDIASSEGEETPGGLTAETAFLPMDDKIEVERRVIDKLMGYALAAGSMMYARRSPLEVGLMGAMIGQNPKDLSDLIDTIRPLIYTEAALAELSAQEKALTERLEQERRDAETGQQKVVSDDALLAATSKLEAN